MRDGFFFVVVPPSCQVLVPKPFDFGVGVIGISPRKPDRHPHLPISHQGDTTTARNAIGTTNKEVGRTTKTKTCNWLELSSPAQ